MYGISELISLEALLNTGNKRRGSVFRNFIPFGIRIDTHELEGTKVPVSTFIVGTELTTHRLPNANG